MSEKLDLSMTESIAGVRSPNRMRHGPPRESLRRRAIGKRGADRFPSALILRVDREEGSADTPIGPLYFGYGHTADGNSSWYLFLGRP